MTIPFSEFFCLNRKFLLYNFLSRNLKLRYRRSVIGYLWTLLVPLSQMGIYYFVYRIVMHIQIPNYLAFVFSGILPWTFFVSSLNESLESLVGGHSLLVHAPVPIQLFPASSTFTNFVNLIISSPLLFVVALLESTQFISPYWLMVYPLMMLLFVFTYALGFILACLYVYLRDLKHLISLVVQLWLYVTPVLYKVEMIPDRFRWVIWANPLSGFFISLRQILFEGRFPEPGVLALFVAWTFGLLVVADQIRARFALKVVEII